jgi:DNA-binding protein Fis
MPVGMRTQTHGTAALPDVGIREHQDQSQLTQIGWLNEAEGHALVGRPLHEVERNLIIDTLRHCVGNRTHAANILGISIRTLRNKLRAYSASGLPIPSPGSQSGRRREADVQSVVTAPINKLDLAATTTK